MFHLEDVLRLKDAEQVKTIARRHIATLLPVLAFSLLLIVGPFFLLFPLFRWGMPGVIVFLVALSLGILSGARSLFLWDADVLVVTNVRVVDVDQRGLFTRIVSEVLLATVQDVVWSKKGFWESLFRMGTVRLQSSGGSTTIEAKRVPHPEKLHQLISDLSHGSVPLPSVPSGAADPRVDSEQLERIISMLKTFSSEELARVETVLKARSSHSPDSPDIV